MTPEGERKYVNKPSNLLTAAKAGHLPEAAVTYQINPKAVLE